jgi:hypothetical protein
MATRKVGASDKSTAGLTGALMAALMAGELGIETVERRDSLMAELLVAGMGYRTAATWDALMASAMVAHWVYLLAIYSENL